MIESNIIVPSVLPDFEVPESAPNYWQELAAHVWVSTLHNMESDGQKVRQEDLIDGHSIEKAVYNLLVPWLLEDADNDSFFLGELGYLSMSLQEVKNEIENLTTSTGTVKTSVDTVKTSVDTVKTSVDTVKTSVDTVKTSVDAVAYHTDAVSRKPGLNVDTPNLIDDFFSNIQIDSDAIKVAIIAIKSVLEGGNLVLDLVAEAIKEQVGASEENTEVVQEMSDRLYSEIEGLSIADVIAKRLYDSESDLNITELVALAGKQLLVEATVEDPERSLAAILADIESRLFVPEIVTDGEEEPEKSVADILNTVESRLFIPEYEAEIDGEIEIMPEQSVTEVLQGLSVMPNNLTLHVSNLNVKESQEYVERWSAS